MDTSKKELKSMCAKCDKKICYPLAKSDDPLPPIENAPPFCPMRRLPDTIKKANSEYDRTEIREFARLASIQEAECYELTPEGLRTKIPRLEEIIQFARKCNYQKLGLAFCDGLRDEAKITSDILESNGFSVVSVCCKVGQVPKEHIGLKGNEKIMGAELMETMCNPITQAEVLNEEGVDLVILLGLCVGHDSLFFKYCNVPCTVLAVKDRVLAHNPLAAIYLANSPYYGRVKIGTNQKNSGKKVVIPENVRK
ncbi:MAG: DUF1847 domain-containing protein [Syntrophaceae bacterium]|nr:DUF1847 domain-containing protein [Syntrophaceae bacterium]